MAKIGRPLSAPELGRLQDVTVKMPARTRDELRRLARVRERPAGLLVDDWLFGTGGD